MDSRKHLETKLPLCEHFVYTAGKIGMREGYQVVAQSPGISNDLTQSLLEYMYPIGIKVEEFTGSKSLIILDNGKIAYSIVKNIGVGYDGRRGTLLNHTFVMAIGDFEKLGYDTRVFDEYFTKNSLIQGTLQPIQVEPFTKSPSLDVLQKLSGDVLKEILHALFKRSKIALVNFEDNNIIQSILSILPIPLRLVSFSTLVMEPDKQYKYEFIQVPEKAASKVGRGFVSIYHQFIKPVQKHNDVFDESVQVLADMVQTNDLVRLEKMFSDFEKISHKSRQKKNVKLKDMFDKNEFANIIKKENYDKLKQRIQVLYASTEFNQASPRVIVSITKKLGKILEQQLKKQKKSSHVENSTSQLLLAVKILLDCMNYQLEYSEKTISASTKKEIVQEIDMLKGLMKKYDVSESVSTYKFEPFEYMKMMYEQTVNFWMMPLWFLSKKKTSEK